MRELSHFTDFPVFGRHSSRSGIPSGRFPDTAFEYLYFFPAAASLMAFRCGRFGFPPAVRGKASRGAGAGSSKHRAQRSGSRLFLSLGGRDPRCALGGAAVSALVRTTAEIVTR